MGVDLKQGRRPAAPRCGRGPTSAPVQCAVSWLRRASQSGWGAGFAGRSGSPGEAVEGKLAVTPKAFATSNRFPSPRIAARSITAANSRMLPGRRTTSATRCPPASAKPGGARNAPRRAGQNGGPSAGMSPHRSRQRRQVDKKTRQPVPKILAEPALGDHGGQVAMRGGDDPPRPRELASAPDLVPASRPARIHSRRGAWAAGGSSPTSSRRSVPPSAGIRTSLGAFPPPAPVNAPCSCPNNCESISSEGITRS